jgi:aerobic carbon-monoxide dehydrogenase medium subunit
MVLPGNAEWCTKDIESREAKMKPAAFEYFAPKTTKAALELLTVHRSDARILAGGQSLVPLLNFRMARFRYLIDINEISELSYIRVDGDTLCIGALTRYRAIETSPTVAAAAPLLAEATKWVGHLPVRTRGTIGGSLAHADPAAEYAAVMLALDGRVVLQSEDDVRTLAVSDFIQGMFTTALADDEMLIEVRVPRARSNQIFGFEEFARRPGDLAVMGIALRLDLDGERVETARIVALGGQDGACRVPEAEAEIENRPLSSERIENACRAAEGIHAHADVHATAALRQHLCGALLRRVLGKATAAQASQHA